MFVALGIKCAMSMLHIVICGLPGSTFFLQLLSETLLRLRRNKQRDVIKKKYIGLTVKYSLFFPPVLIRLEFSRQLFEK